MIPIRAGLPVAATTRDTSFPLTPSPGRAHRRSRTGESAWLWTAAAGRRGGGLDLPSAAAQTPPSGLTRGVPVPVSGGKPYSSHKCWAEYSAATSASPPDRPGLLLRTEDTRGCWKRVGWRARCTPAEPLARLVTQELRGRGAQEAQRCAVRQAVAPRYPTHHSAHRWARTKRPSGRWNTEELSCGCGIAVIDASVFPRPQIFRCTIACHERDTSALRQTGETHRWNWTHQTADQAARSAQRTIRLDPWRGDLSPPGKRARRRPQPRRSPPLYACRWSGRAAASREQPGEVLQLGGIADAAQIRPPRTGGQRVS